MRATFRHEAHAEVIATVKYYETRGAGLGKAFLGEVEDGLRLIELTPEAYPRVSMDIRKFTLHRFPFILLYTIESDAPVILAVAHQRRRPGYWKKLR